METLELILKVALMLAIWLALSSPFVFGIIKLIGWLRSSKRQSLGVCFSVAVISTLLIAPVPTPIITVFVPSAVAWATGAMQQYWAPNHGWSQQAMSVVLVSYSVTVAVTFYACKTLLGRTEGSTVVAKRT